MLTMRPHDLHIGMLVPQGLLRRGLESVLSGSHRIQFAVATVEEAVRCNRGPLDVFLVHFDVLDADAAAWDRLRAMAPTAGFIVVAAPGREERLLDVARRGARTFLCERDADEPTVLAAVEAAAHGEPILPSRLAAALLRGTTTRWQLTAREREILALVAAGESDSSIGSLLYLSVHGVKKHVKAILAKLEARNRTEAAVRAVLAGICEAPPQPPAMNGHHEFGSAASWQEASA
jgi:DNA-binding NarL/FixJ family response regulator